MIRSEHEEATCGGKTCFATYALARRIAKLSSGRHQSAIMPFRCQHCGQWHNGTTARLKNKFRMKQR